MTDLHAAWLAKHRARFLRHDAHRWIRHDMHRFLRPEYPARQWRPRPEAKGRFNPDQPRVPKGNPDSGQWTADGGTGSGRPEVLD
jgi:hypothetical protein